MLGVVSHRGSLTTGFFPRWPVSRGQRAGAMSQNAVSCRGFESLERYDARCTDSCPEDQPAVRGKAAQVAVPRLPHIR